MNATMVLLPSATSRTPTLIPVVHFSTTHLLFQAHLAITGCTRSCTWKTVDEAVSASGLEMKFCFVTSSIGYMRRHDLRFQRLVVPLGLLLCSGLVLVSIG
jgi:hypothetical protein